MNVTRALNASLLSSALLLAAGVAFYSQAAAPDYVALFKAIAPYAALLIGVVTLYAWRVRSWSRWVAVGSVVLATMSFAELGFRIFK